MFPTAECRIPTPRGSTLPLPAPPRALPRPPLLHSHRAILLTQLTGSLKSLSPALPSRSGSFAYPSAQHHGSDERTEQLEWVVIAHGNDLLVSSLDAPKCARQFRERTVVEPDGQIDR